MNSNSQSVRVYGWDRAQEIVATHAWESWTSNGRGMDQGMLQQTAKSALGAAANSYRELYTDDQWIAACLALLRGE